MGREVRRVPPNWQHPKDEKGHYVPLYDRDFDAEAQEWVENCALWARGEHPDQLSERAREHPRPSYFWEWHGNPPDPESYRPAFTEEPTWFQVYETVSEGTPITPAFATAEELVEYLVTVGNEWDGPCSREVAERFVKSGWAPSMVISNGVLRLGIHSA